jgi:hypothetical protein
MEGILIAQGTSGESLIMPTVLPMNMHKESGISQSWFEIPALVERQSQVLSNLSHPFKLCSGSIRQRFQSLRRPPGLPSYGLILS